MTTPQHEYIITGEQLCSIEQDDYPMLICNQVRIRPLSSAIQQEREKVLSFLDELISDRVSDARKREIVESLRTPTGATMTTPTHERHLWDGYI